MRIGITGHQRLRDPDDWTDVRHDLEAFLRGIPSPLVGVTSLAAGADQIFAEVVLGLGGALECVVPFQGYERTFASDEERDAYFGFLGKCQRKVLLERTGTDGEAFWTAGRRVVDESDAIVAVWDGRAPGGLGGTADIVSYAEQRGKKIFRITPKSERA